MVEIQQLEKLFGALCAIMPSSGGCSLHKGPSLGLPAPKKTLTHTMPMFQTLSTTYGHLLCDNLPHNCLETVRLENMCRGCSYSPKDPHKVQLETKPNKSLGAKLELVYYQNVKGVVVARAILVHNLNPHCERQVPRTNGRPNYKLELSSHCPYPYVVCHKLGEISSASYPSVSNLLQKTCCLQHVITPP